MTVHVAAHLASDAFFTGSAEEQDGRVETVR